MTAQTYITESTAPDLEPFLEIIKSFLEHLEFTLGNDKFTATPVSLFNALAHSVRDRMLENWLDTQQAYYNTDVKRVYYLSMEFLMGRAMENSLINLGSFHPET